jgi:hypothetical protein
MQWASGWRRIATSASPSLMVAAIRATVRTCCSCPEYGVAIFALTNRTYAGPTAPVWDTAVALKQAGLLTPRTLPVSPALATTYRAAGAMYGAGSPVPGRRLLAMNFLMDRSTENWAREFSALGSGRRVPDRRADHFDRSARRADSPGRARRARSKVISCSRPPTRPVSRRCGSIQCRGNELGRDGPDALS